MADCFYETNGYNNTSTFYAGSSGIRGGGEYPVQLVISGRNDNKLVFQTFDKAIVSNPNAKPIFHSDRGFQYISRVFQEKLKENEMIQSMSRVGHCIDNGPIERFWGIIKSEIYQMYEITDERSLQHTIKNYIRFYRDERPQSRYNCKIPTEIRSEALVSTIPQIYPIAKNIRIEKYKAKWCAPNQPHEIVRLIWSTLF